MSVHCASAYLPSVCRFGFAGSCIDDDKVCISQGMTCCFPDLSSGAPGLKVRRVSIVRD